jgi:HD-GYP domain-containing protein (c-di-GMP phosphodiesterase class II)
MSSTLPDIDAERASRARALLESLPDGLYRALPNPCATADLCSHTVARALRNRNPRVIREWLDYERTPLEGAAALACLDLAVQLQLRDVTDERTIAFSRTLRVEAAEHVSFHAASTAGADAPETAALVEGLLMAIGVFSPPLARHSRDVAVLAGYLGNSAGLSGHGLVNVKHAAHVHELGRLRLDRALHDTPAVFDRSEVEHVRAVLADVSSLEDHAALIDVADVVYGMYRAENAAASTEVRVVRLADAFVSLCESRPHREALSPREALDVLWPLRGQRYDSACMDMLVDFLELRRRYAQSA